MGLLAERQRPLRREEFERIIAAGLFRDERIELIEGVIVRMSPQNTPPAAAIQMLNRLLLPPLLGRADVRVQLPFAAGEDSLPEPDVALVEPRYFKDAHPARAFLIIEVADASLKFDRHEKADLYARAGVPEYWIVNIADKAIERHSDPAGGSYTRVTPYRPGESLATLAFEDVTVRVAEVFGE
jgi:Uma2 family endonuclease